MRCQDIKRRLSERPGELDREMCEHIRQCPVCARFAEALHVFSSLLHASQSDDDIPQLAEFRTRVESRYTSKTVWEKIMSQTINAIRTRPRLISLGGLAFTALIITALVPFSYSRTVGWDISLPLEESQAAAPPGAVQSVINALGYYQAAVTMADDNSRCTYRVTGVNSEKSAGDIANFLAAVNMTPKSTTVKPIVVPSSASLLAQAADLMKAKDDSPKIKLYLDDGHFMLNGLDIMKMVNSRDLSDGEIAELITNTIGHNKNSQGILKVDVTTSDDGLERTIRLDPPDNYKFDIKSPEMIVNRKKQSITLRDGDDELKGETGLEMTLSVNDSTDTPSRSIILRFMLDEGDDK